MTISQLIIITTFLTITTHLFTTAVSHRPLSNHHHCHHHNLPPQTTLRPDQFTVLINGYSESRIPILHTITKLYSSSPSVSTVVILWGNPNTPTKTLTQLSHNLSVTSPGHAPITVVKQPSSSLNARFLPRAWITTRAVLICDDDIETDIKTNEFAFNVWRNNPEQLVGLFVRSHEYDLISKSWLYTVHPDKYSIVLTKYMLMKTEYLYMYSCGGGEAMRRGRVVVDNVRNCEDILMNFVAANGTGGGVVLVGGGRVRDWGDGRNDGGERVDEGVVRVGLSSRRKEHRKRRGECVTEFHRVFGKMMLKYRYGKVVDSVAEQGLCEKGGKLVFCDRFSK